MILVTGAGGKTGQAVIRALRARDTAVRGLVRRQSQMSLLESWGAEAATGDMLSAADVRQAAEGVSAVYHIAPNMTRHERPMGRIAQEAAAAVGAKFVYHSVLHPQTEAMPHHWHKMHVEENLLESGIPFTILQPAPYMQNLLAYEASMREEGTLMLPYPPETKLSLVDLADVAEAAAVVLTEPDHEGATYELVGTVPLTQQEVAQHFSQQLGREVRAFAQPLAQWETQARKSGLNGYTVDSLLRMFNYYAHHGLVGNPNVLTWLLGRRPTTFSQFLERVL